MNPEIDKIILGDCRDVMKTYPDNFFHSVVCDPPYELTSGKTTDKKNSGGFMGKKWDGTGIAYNQDVWAGCLRVLKPGGHMLAFGGTRTYHRMACAIEDAGFEIRDSLHWVYGCLSPDTEVMINGQWERYQKANIGDLTICYNNETNSYSWQPIQEVFEYRIKDTAYRIRSDLTNQIVTRGHRCLIEREGKLLFCLAEEAAREREIYVPVLEDLRGLLEALPMPYTRAGAPEHDVLLGLCKNSDGAGESLREKEGQYRADMPGLWKEIPNLESMGKESPNSNVLQALQRRPSGRGLEEARTQRTRGVDAGKPRGLLREDERVEKPGVERRCDLLQNSRELCGCEICPMPSEVLINGPERRLCNGAPLNSCSENEAMPEEVRGCASYQPRPNRQPIRESSAIQDQPGPQEIRGAGITRTTLARIEPIEYDGPVWCVRVPTGAFVARRNGKIFVTGNSGFPKSLDISKALDKMAGAEREVIEEDHRVHSSSDSYGFDRSGGKGTGFGEDFQRTAPSTDAAKQWAGYGTALKPAHEPIVLVRKPLSESTIAGNVLRWGCGGLNIDGCRIEIEANPKNGVSNPGQRESESVFGGGYRADYHASGRFPSNLIWSHSPNCKRIGTKKIKGTVRGNGNAPIGEPSNGAIPPMRRGSLIDRTDADGLEEVESWDCAPDCPSWEFAKAGVTKSGAMKKEVPAYECESTTGFLRGRSGPSNQHGDSGSVSRFFKSCPFTEEDIPAFVYYAKAGRAERNGSTHPTMKPVALMRHLCRLICPPNGIILDPFAGSGTTCLAATLEGFGYVGIEKEVEYCEIARRRVAAVPARLDRWAVGEGER